MITNSSNLFIFISPIGSIKLRKKEEQQKQKKQNKSLTKPAEEKRKI